VSLSAYLLVLSALLLTVWLLKPGKPVINQQLSEAKLGALFEALMYRGVDGATLRIFTRTERLSLYFVKYVRVEGRSGIECDLSLESFTQLDADALRIAIDPYGLCIHDRPAQANDDHLRIDVGQNVAKAVALTRIIFEQMASVQLYSDCVAVLDEKVMTLDVPRLSGVRRPGR
jgi:hypothetical protein